MPRRKPGFRIGLSTSSDAQNDANADWIKPKYQNSSTELVDHTEEVIDEDEEEDE